MNQMPNEIVITIPPSGKATALHMDEFPLTILGDIKLGRASTIEHDEADQSFFVLPTGKTEPVAIATGFSGYDIARDFEVKWLQACMVAQADPHSPEGQVLAVDIRNADPRFNVHGRGTGGV